MTAIKWKTGTGGDWSTASDWSPGAVPGASDDVTIGAAGTYTVTISSAEAAHSLTLSAAHATIQDSSALSIGSTLTASAGTFSLTSSGTLVGGTVAAAGAAFSFGGGTLSGVTWQGALTLGSQSQTLFIENGLSVTGSTGSGNGTINLSAGNDVLIVLDSETLNNATLSFGAGNNDYFYVNGTTAAQTVTLGSNFSITQTGGTNYISGYYGNYYGNLINSGIVTVSGGTLNEYDLTQFTNSGTITVSGKGALSADTSGGTFSNSGLISVSAGAASIIGSGSFANTGTVAVSGGTFDLAVAVTGSGGSINVTGGTFNLQTALTSLNLLSIGPNGVFELSSGGTLSGTVTPGNGVFDFNFGTLSGVTWQGALTLGSQSQTLFIENGLSVTGSTGSGNGTINLSAGNDVLIVLDSETLNNATLSFGAGNNDYFYVNGTTAAQTVTLGSNFSITQTGGTNYISGYYGNYYGNLVDFGTISVSGGTLSEYDLTQFTNSGTIAVSGKGAFSADTSGGTFTNSGLISVSAGTASIEGSGSFANTAGITVTNGTFISTAATFTTLKAGTITGGRYEADSGATIQIYTNALATTDASDIVLSGSTSVFEFYNQSSGKNTTLDSKLTTIASTGTLALLGGRSFAASAAFTNGGLLQLGGGTFSTAGFTEAAGAHLTGFGTLSAPVVNTGNIEAAGGLLAVTGSVTGTGAMQVDAGATLELKSTTSATETVTFSGQGGTLKLDAAAGFAGLLAAFAPGDTINIGTLVATNASLTGTSLAITLSNGTMLTETLTAASPGEHVGVSADGHNVSGFRLASASAHTPEPVAFGNVHVGAVVSQAIGITNTASADGYSENLDAAMGMTTGGVTDAGTLFGLTPGASNNAFLSVGLNTSAAGTISGTALINLNSDGSGVDGYGTTSLGSQTVNVTGAVYAYAAPTLANGGTVALGNFHVGNSVGGVLMLTNSAATGGYSEALDASLSGASAGFNASGSVSLLGAGATDSTDLAVGTSASAGGTVSGSATLALASDGTGIDGLGTTTLGSQNVSITGTAYAYAAAQFGSLTVNLGVVHVGSTAQQALSLSNVALANGYSEALDASFLSSTGSANYSGALAGLAAGRTDSSSLLVGLSTSASGTFSGTDVLKLVSDGSGIDGLGVTGLGTGTIAVSGIVDNYALAAFQDVTSGQSIAGSGANFTLNLGSVAQGGAVLGASLGALNAATGLADLLGGTLSTAGGSGFSNTGFGTFSGLGAGQSEHAQGVSLSTSTAGTFTETVLLTSAGSNASGYNGALATETLTITGTVTPAGSTTYVLSAGPNVIVGADGGDVFQASAASLNSRDQLTGGMGANVIQLMGGGSFDLGAPNVFANIPTVTAVEGQAASKSLPATAQTVYLRDGGSTTLNVVAGTAAPGNTTPETITIYGGTGTDTLNLSTGHDSAILYTGTDMIVLGGSANAVMAGGGTALVQGVAAAASASVVGNASSTTSLEITTAGTVTLNAADTYLNVKLDGASKLTLGTLGFITANGGNGGDTLIAAAGNQTLIGGAGDTLTGYTGGGDIFAGASAALTGDTVGNWATGDVLDITDMNSATLHALTFKSGKLTVTDGTHTSTITVKGLSGTTLSLSNFTVLGTDGHGGTEIGYHG